MPGLKDLGALLCKKDHKDSNSWGAKDPGLYSAARNALVVLVVLLVLFFFVPSALWVVGLDKLASNTMQSLMDANVLGRFVVASLALGGASAWLGCYLNKQQ